MKILCLNWRDIKHPMAGGAETYLFEIAKRLTSEHKVVLFCGKYKGCKTRDEIDGVKIIRQGGNFSVYLYAILSYLINLRGEGYDIIVDSINGVPFFTPLYVRKPKVAIVHHLVKKEILFRELPLPFAFIAWLAENMIPFLYRKVPIITVSRSSRQELIEFGISEERVHIIYNGIEHTALGCADKSPKPLIAYVGRIKKYKQVDHLLQAFEMVKREVPEAEAIIAGRGDYNELRRLVKAEINSNITLAGEVSEAEKLKIMKKAWIFVTPSTKEGWGVSVIEANACGTPAIAYDVPGLRDSIRDGETGLLVPRGNVEQLARVMVKLLTDSELRAKLSQNALNWASNFSWDRSTEEFAKILEEVANA